MDNVKVAIRLRPLNDKEKKDSDTRLCIVANPSLNSVSLALTPESRVFTYDFVADELASQEQVFAAVGRPVATACLSGFNCTIFAYGQTGAGKTYTILGPDLGNSFSGSELESRGLLPRCAEFLFDSIARETAAGEVEFLVKCSYLEIYQETIIDLLDLSGESRALQLREDMKRGVYVEGLGEETLGDVRDAYHRILAGNRNRHIGATSMNKESSRSHTVFTLLIECKDMRTRTVNFRTSRFHLIDLAGSERQRASDAAGERLKEAGMINKSLSALGNVINSLVDIAEGKNRHVHYRDSKLTFLLKDSLGGNAKTLIIANISPAATAFRETLSTLKFVQRAKLIRNKAVINEDTSGTATVLKAEVKRLKALLTDGTSCPRCIGLVQERKLGTERAKDLEILLAQNLRVRKDTEAAFQREIERRDQHIQTLEDTITRHEKRLNHDKLLIKMKDAALARSLQNKESPGEDVLRLEAEVRVLREMVDCSPEEARLRGEVEQLRARLEAAEGKEPISVIQCLHNSELLANKLETLLGTLRDERKQREADNIEAADKSEELQLAEFKATYEDRILSLQEAREEERRTFRDREEQLLSLLDQARHLTSHPDNSPDRDTFSPRPSTRSQQSVFSTLVFDLDSGKIQALEQEKAEMREELERREEELRECREELEVMSAAGEFIKMQATECAQRAEDRTSQNIKLQDEIRELKIAAAKQAELLASLRTSQGDALQVALQDLEGLRKLISEQEAGLKDKNREISNLRDVQSGLEARVETAKAQERLANEAAVDLQRKVGTLTQDLTTATENLEAVQVELTFFQEENKHLQQTDSAALIAAQQQELASLKQEISTFRQLSKASDSPILQLSRYEPDKHTHQSLQQEVEAYRAQLRSATSKYTQLQETVRALSRTAEELRSQPGDERSGREMERLRRENEALREEVRVKVEILSNTNRNILATRSEIETWKVSIEDKNKAIRALKSELREKETALSRPYAGSEDCGALKSSLQAKEMELAVLRENSAKRLKQAEWTLEKQRKEVDQIAKQSELLRLDLSQCRSQLKAAVLEKETLLRRTEMPYSPRGPLNSEKLREEVRNLNEGLMKIREFVFSLPVGVSNPEETDVVDGTIRAVGALYERLESRELELSEKDRELQRRKAKLSLLENERALWKQQRSTRLGQP